MPASSAAIRKQLRALAAPETATLLQGFFKTGPGEYASRPYGAENILPVGTGLYLAPGLVPPTVGGKMFKIKEFPGASSSGSHRNKDLVRNGKERRMIGETENQKKERLQGQK